MYVPFPGGLPTREQLDAVVPDRPAFMRCYDGHTGWVNSAALRLAGIDRDTPDPQDGVIVRDPRTGEATGALKEGAQDLISRHIPQPSEAETLAAMRESIAAMHAAGITAIQDAWTEVAELPLWRSLLAAGDLRLRTRLALPMRPGQSLDAGRGTLDEYDAAIADLRGGAFLDAGILKGFADGVVEARTAAMLEPYEDDASTGLPEWEADQLDAFTAEADRRGWQLEIHAIGDGGIRMVLDAYERLAEANERRDRRHRVEHIETITRADIPRFAELGVVASMQPYHADPSPNQIDVWAGNIGKERAGRPGRGNPSARTAASWPSARIGRWCRSTRCSRSIRPSIARRKRDIRQVAGCRRRSCPCPRRWRRTGTARPSRRTRTSERGTIPSGALADVVVLDRDILAHGPSSIIGTKVALTVVDGQVVHRSEELS